jgi:hypothetical protein
LSRRSIEGRRRRRRRRRRHEFLIEICKDYSVGLFKKIKIKIKGNLFIKKKIITIE